MDHVKLLIAITAVAVASLPAIAAAPVASGVAVNTAQAAPISQAAQQPVQPGVRNDARRVNPAASAASGAQDDADVRTTTTDGRATTRNAHDRNATTAASSPND